MDITSFIPSQRQAILERFQQVEALGLGAVRIELKVANPVCKYGDTDADRGGGG